MKIILSKIATLTIFIVLFSFSNIFAEKLITEQQVFNVLLEQIKKDELYKNSHDLSCLIFIAEEETGHNIDVAIHEKHDGKCPGDPNTSPIVDRFRINRTTKAIQWYDVLEAGFVPYATMLATRKNKTP